ncbi:hypothetical protein IT570_12410 [Candidatus Sumerlaeota bacterium]|nr:hypothetical protein [Candidatus Sumerlaeota bacterium]
MAGLRGKTALVLGAEFPAGRAVALQLSRSGCRVIISGHDLRKLQLIDQLLTAKGGNPVVAVLPGDPAKDLGILREARDHCGHLHFVVNALSVVGDSTHEHHVAGKRAHAAWDVVLQLVTGRGAVRFLTLWLEAAGKPPEFPATCWHSLVRVSAIQTESDNEASMGDAKVRCAGAADTICELLLCPGSACPVEVKLEPRALKA